jgi:hypothetical protein
MSDDNLAVASPLPHRHLSIFSFAVPTNAVQSLHTGHWLVCVLVSALNSQATHSVHWLFVTICCSAKRSTNWTAQMVLIPDANLPLWMPFSHHSLEIEVCPSAFTELSHYWKAIFITYLLRITFLWRFLQFSGTSLLHHIIIEHPPLLLT